MIDGFASPAAFALGLLAIPIVAMYMLKARRPRFEVPSTFLWSEVTQNLAASKPWQKLRPTVLLILQLLLLAALVAYLAKPYREALGIDGDHLVFVVDASGSMLAEDRIDAAKQEAKRLLSATTDSALVSVIAAGPRPAVLVSATPNRTLARRAIERVESSEGAADFAEAFLLAQSLETPMRPASIVLLSDGGLTVEQRALIPPGTIFRAVGTHVSDLAITGLDVGEAAGGFTAFVTIRNSGGRDRTTEVVLELDGTRVISSQVRVPAGASTEKSFSLGPRTGRLQAKISAADALEHDDRAYAVLDRARPHRILLVSPGNLFLEKLLGNLPGAALTVTSTATDAKAFDLAVYDRVTQTVASKIPTLYVASPPPGSSPAGSISAPVIDYLSPGDPLLEQVDLSEVAIAAAASVEIPGARTLVGAGSTALIATWSEGVVRRAWIAFDLHQSNLPVQVAFPILGDHLASWLIGSDRIGARFAGEPLAPVASGAVTSIEVTLPGGRKVRTGVEQPFTDTGTSGFYEISYLAGGEVVDEEVFALSFPPAEADLAPRTLVPAPDETRPGLSSDARAPLGPALLLAVLALLLFEWWWAHGRPSLVRLRPRPGTS